MPLRALNDRGAKLVMVGGKGGVGKTTCSSAIAYGLAQQGKKVLVISSDPTPSLSDIYEKEIGSRETRILDDLELYGLEVSSDIVLQKWKERFGPEIYEVISTFADVDYDFVNYIGTAPGIEEEYMLYFIVERVKSGAYDIVVWDTAPAGHTLHLLQLPHLFLTHLEAATKFYLNMYSFVERFRDAVSLKSSKKTLLRTIEGWQTLSNSIIDFIRDKSAARYVMVTIPEALGVKLTERMVQELGDNGLSVGDLIINHVVKETDCEFHRQRRAMQDGYIHALEKAFSGMNLVRLYLSAYEIKGIDRIRGIWSSLDDGA